MLKTYVAADLKLFDKAAARKIHKTVEDYNDFIINNINKVVDKNDFVVLLGEISVGSTISTLNYLSKINSKIQILDEHFGKIFKETTKDEIPIDMSFVGLGHISLGEDFSIYIPNSKVDYDLKKELLSDFVNLRIAAPNSYINSDKLYNNRILNISLEEWGYEPIELGERLPQIIDDMEIFSKMKTTEEVIS